MTGSAIFDRKRYISGADLQWAPGSAGSVPDGAVECEGSYVGRAHHDGGIIVGPVVCAESCCMIGYCGEQFNKDEYEVSSDSHRGAPRIFSRGGGEKFSHV